MFGFLSRLPGPGLRLRSLEATAEEEVIMSGHGRSWLVVIGFVVGALMLGGCTGAATESSTPAESAAAQSTPAQSPGVESASPGEVAGAKHPRSRCEDQDDLTANIRLYNNMQRIPLVNFALVNGDDSRAIWLKQTMSKSFDTDVKEGEDDCASIPWAVKNGPAQTYYYSDGREWGDHPGWWGHQQECEWCDAPKGYANFTCSNYDGKNFTACPDAALTGDVTARWDATDTENNDTKLKSHPPCTTGSPVIGCYLLIPEPDQKSSDFDFGFNSYAWTAPMQTTVSTRFSARDATYPETRDSQTSRSQPLYVAWEVRNASIAQGRWVGNTSPDGQVATVKRSLVIGGYAKAASETTTMSFRLYPKYFTNSRGEALNCTQATTRTTCTYVQESETPDSIEDFFSEDPFITVNASLTLRDVETTKGPPKVEAAPITCRSSFTTADSRNLTVKCDPESDAGRSSYSYGATWLVGITGQGGKS